MFPHIFKAWHMPDGTKTANKPKDGQVWSRWDSQGSEIEKWMWEGTKDCWVNISSGKPTKQNTRTFAINCPMDLDNYTYNLDGPAHPMEILNLKCDCGSSHVSSPKHSTWCQIYDPKQ